MFGSQAVTEALIGVKHEERSRARAMDCAGSAWEEVPDAAGQPVLAKVTGALVTLVAIAGAAGRVLGRTVQRA